MKIYIDLILLLNFVFDFLLLLTVSIILRRNTRINKIILGGFIGSLSTLLLFINVNSVILFLLKLIISILMILITFGYQNIKYFLRNIFYLYMTSIVLGGFIYYLNTTFSYKQKGMIFYNNGLSINYIVLIIFSPIILYIYIRQGINLKNTYNNYYNISFYYNDKLIEYTGFLDTGNRLLYKNRPVILINKNDFKEKIKDEKIIMIPYKTIEKNNILRGFKIEELMLNKKEIKKDIYIGLIDEEINIDGVSCILHYKLLEE